MNFAESLLLQNQPTFWNQDENKEQLINIEDDDGEHENDRDETNSLDRLLLDKTEDNLDNDTNSQNLIRTPNKN